VIQKVRVQIHPFFVDLAPGMNAQPASVLRCQDRFSTSLMPVTMRLAHGCGMVMIFMLRLQPAPVSPQSRRTPPRLLPGPPRSQPRSPWAAAGFRCPLAGCCISTTTPWLSSALLSGEMNSTGTLNGYPSRAHTISKTRRPQITPTVKGFLGADANRSATERNPSSEPPMRFADLASTVTSNG
jgi:hypothetical protein